MITNKANITEPAEIGQEEVIREIDNYLREIHFLQEKMKEDRKQINALRADTDERLENIDQILNRIATAQG